MERRESAHEKHNKIKSMVTRENKFSLDLVYSMGNIIVGGKLGNMSGNNTMITAQIMKKCFPMKPWNINVSLFYLFCFDVCGDIWGGRRDLCLDRRKKYEESSQNDCIKMDSNGAKEENTIITQRDFHRNLILNLWQVLKPK